MLAVYALALDALDPKKQAALFADSSIMAGPKGAVSESREDFLKKAEQAAAFYKSMDQTVRSQNQRSSWP